jgi:hypothetical protein
MRQSESIKNLLPALMDAQKEIPTMPKNAKAYGYNYTDLDTITSVIKPILARHNISYMQSVGMDDEGRSTLTTRIFSRDGEYIEDVTALPVIQSAKNNSAQTMGMAITYVRRYALCAMLGITSDEDVDANTVMGNSVPQNVQNVQSAMNGTVIRQGNSDVSSEINKLISMVDANGAAVFSDDEKNSFRAMWKQKPPMQILSEVRAALKAKGISA